MRPPPPQGKTSLHEIGLGITGLNTRTGTALNPYAYPSHYCGGSSSGSAAVLAAGLCPVAMGAWCCTPACPGAW